MFRIRRGLRGFLFIALVLFFSGHSVFAQQIFGSIVGTVTDPTGSAVNNAKVTITDQSKGTSFVVNTNDSGNYTRGQLIPGTYKGEVEAPGFQKARDNDVVVGV